MILIALLLIPFIAGLLCLVTKKHAGAIMVAATLIDMLLGAYATFASPAISEAYAYIPSLGISLSLAASGISAVLLLMCTLVFAAAAIANVYFMNGENPSFHALFGFAEAGAIGLFLTQNLFVLFLFWDVTIIAAFFMLFRFGGSDRRYAATKFLIYSIASSSMLLIGIMLLYAYGGNTFDMHALAQGAAAMPIGMQTVIFALLVVAFMVKMPMFPFHLWMPDAYAEAPPGTSALLAGIMSKFGLYGLFIVFNMLPIAQDYGKYFAELALFSIFYAALALVAQRDVKRAVSYASMIETGILGFAIAGLAQVGLQGAAFGMLSHALVITLLLLVAFAIEKSFGTANINNLLGVINESRFLAYSFLFGALAFAGFPLTTGFITDLLVFLGSFSAFGIFGLLPLAALLLGAAYFVWIFQKSFVGTHLKPRIISSPDWWLMLAMVFLAAVIMLIGSAPGSLLGFLSVIGV